MKERHQASREASSDSAAGSEPTRRDRELEDFKYALDQSTIVAVTDQRGIIRYANDKFCEISKYAREELIGQDHRIVNSGYHPKEFIRDLWRTIARGEVWRGELRNRAKDGSIYWVDTTIVPFLDERGKPYQYLAIRHDITDRKRVEAELREHQALARLGQMAAVVAHEVKNPLAGIAGAIQVIGGRLPVDSPDRAVIVNILRRVDYLNDRVRDLLSFARPRAPRFGLVRPRELLRATVSLLSKDPRLSEVEIAITGDDATLSGDPELLRDLFSNLLLNAAQAMDCHGEVRVALRVGEGRCRIEIEDRGPGIPADSRERVFEPFYSTKSQGTGLGLAIARNVVLAHHGSIELADAPGGGTRVTVVLPLEQRARPALQGKPASSER